MLTGQVDEIGRELFFVGRAVRDLALGRAMLPRHQADAALGHLDLLTDVLNARPPKRRA